MKHVTLCILSAAACLFQLSCSNGSSPAACAKLHSLETSTKSTTVQTRSGAVAGYIEDGVYL